MIRSDCGGGIVLESVILTASQIVQVDAVTWNRKVRRQTMSLRYCPQAFSLNAVPLKGVVDVRMEHAPSADASVLWDVQSEHWSDAIAEL